MTARVLPGPFTVPPGQGSVEERLHDLQRALCLINAAAFAAANHDETIVDAGTVADAVAQLARDASERVSSLISDLPVNIANWEPGDVLLERPKASRAARRAKGGAR